VLLVESGVLDPEQGVEELREEVESGEEERLA
jgi:hypothetical protein